MRKTAVFPVLAALVLTVAFQGCSRPAPDEQPSAAAPAPAATPAPTPAAAKPVGGDFTLTDQNGKPFELSQLRGKIALLFFGYTLCPDACPATLARLTRTYALLGPELRDQVVTVFVSVDAGRDKPQTMKEYLDYFDINAVGLSGTKQQIDPIVAKYGARYEIVDAGSAAGYLVNHSTDLYLIDQAGKVHQVFKHEDPPEKIAAGVKELLPARS
jgi:cytochrome oxidase Cu insertion factor (SCO1/SenC/PrrC family)